jgi:hypothetical protein
VKKVVHEARRRMLNLEIKSKYAHSDIIKMELYSLHLLLARSVHPIVWDSIETDTRNLVNSKYIKRRMVQKKKFRVLIARERLVLNENVVRPNFVINKSSQNFSSEELGLLNKGLKYKPKPKFPPTNDIIVSVETSIRNLNDEEKALVRNGVASVCP